MLKEIYKKIKKYDTIVIARHIGVDPDALASQMALRESIRKTFPNKSVYAVGSGSTKFNYLPKLDKQDEYQDAFLIIVDTPDKKRIDVNNFDSFSDYIKIDHHPFVENFGGIEYIDDTASSASEIIYRLIEETPLVLDYDIARIIFLGMVSDTNRFLFNSSSNTFEVVTKLLKKFDLNLPELYSNIFMRPLNEVRLQGYISQNMNVTEHGLGWIKITNDVISKFGVDVGSAGNLINNFNYIEEVIVWVFISEDVKNNLIKINIRSRGPVINHVAEKYNGGGHRLASGAKVSCMEEAEALIEELEDVCKDYLEKMGDSNED